MFGWRKKKEESKHHLSTRALPHVPEHVAIIMDGNGRWAKSQGKPRMYGHRAGADKLKDVCKMCVDYGVKYLTVYAFSTENWSRPEAEVNALMQLVIDFFSKYDAEMAKEGIRLRFAGDLSALPQATLATVRHSEKISENRDRLQLIVCLNYGAKQEIAHAVSEVLAKQQINVASERLSIDEIVAQIEQHLWLADVPAPDLIIRPGGEQRLSNFLLWQAAYAELWFCSTLWPDFSRQDFHEALVAFAKRERRYGGVSETK